MNIRAIATAGLALGFGVALAPATWAESNIDPAPGVELTVNEDTPITVRAPGNPYVEGLEELYSGWLYRDESTRAMQMDDFENPAMPFVDAGIEAWSTPMGSEGKSCADCHGAIEEGMAGVRAEMPKVTEAGELWTLEDYVNNCATTRMGAEAFAVDKSPIKNLTAAISMQSRGMPVNVAIDGAAEPFWKMGEELYYTRTGLLQMSCASCHEQNNNNMIRGDHLSQGHINAFPVYRLKTGGLVSIGNRFFGCVRDTRAESYAKDSPEFHALELYVASRGNGLSVEGVGVRP